VHDGNDVCELGFEDGIEVCGGALGHEGVAVGKCGEDADSDNLLAHCVPETFVAIYISEDILI
jgi:hypothetical protein